MISFKDYLNEDLDEAIKGWKHAHSDIAKMRAAAASAGNDVKLVRLKKDGKESGMHDATKTFKSEDEARAHHANMVKLNPGRGIAHNLYVGGEHKEVLKEEVELDEETKKEAHLKKMREKAEQQRLRDIATARARGDLRTPSKSGTGKIGMNQPKGVSIDIATGKVQSPAELSVGRPSYRFEHVELDEVAKPKGIVDKNVGKPPKESKSGFKTGQRVAHYRGMGKTLHGNVTNPDAVSGGTKGAMVKFEHGTEFVPHKELKDAGEYWKSEDEAMRKERAAKK